MNLSQEEIDKIVDAFKKFVDSVVEAAKNIVEAVINIFQSEFIKKLCEKYRYYKKYNMIYNRTKSKRICKKQMSLIRKKVFI